MPPDLSAPPPDLLERAKSSGNPPPANAAKPQPPTAEAAAVSVRPRSRYEELREMARGGVVGALDAAAECANSQINQPGRTPIGVLRSAPPNTHDRVFSDPTAQRSSGFVGVEAHITFATGPKGVTVESREVGVRINQPKNGNPATCMAEKAGLSVVATGVEAARDAAIKSMLPPDQAKNTLDALDRQKKMFATGAHRVAP